MHRAKIVCTLGPAVDTPELIGKLVAAGMDVVRQASDESGHGVGIIADL